MINKKDYKPLTPFKGWVLENFPFIEADFDAITNYQLICKITEYLNTVIYNQNQVQDLSNELVDGYNNLLNYVNNYFDNLDVQEEINKKLDEMAEDGTLTNLIETYINKSINPLITAQNEVIESINNKVNMATSGSPLVASSTSEMTDTTKVYVNTTDGKWYYYDGDSWEIGGTYLSNDAGTTLLAENELGIKYTTFTVTSTSSTVKNIMIPATIKAGDTIEFNLISLSANITNYAATLWTSGGKYKQLKSNLLKNEKQIFVVPDDYSEYNRLQMYITTTASILDTDIDPYVYVYGDLKTESYNNNKNITTNTSDIEVLQDAYTKEYGTFKTTWTRIYNAASHTIFQNTIDEIPEGNIFSFNVETTEEADNIDYYNLTLYNSDEQYINLGPFTINKIQEIACPNNCVKFSIYVKTTTELDPSKITMTLNVYGDTNSRIFNLENSTQNILYNSKILIMSDSISTDSYGNYKKWVTDLCDDFTFNSAKVTNNSYHATGFVATYQEGGVVVSDTFYNRLTAISNKSSYDLVITFGGINDYIQGVAWSDFTTAVDTYLDYLVKNFTQAKLIIISPLRTYNIYPNAAGKYQTDYDDYIKQKAKEYCLPILNLTDESGFCPFVTEFKNMWTLLPQGYETHDGVHPNADYQKLYLAPMIKKFINESYNK